MSSNIDASAVLKRALVWGIALVVVLAVALLLWRVAPLLMLAFLALLVATALHPVVERQVAWGVPRVVAVLATYMLLLAILAAVLFFVIPPLVGQALELIQNLPQIAERIEAWLEQSILPLIPGSSPGELARIRGRLVEMIPVNTILVQAPLIVLEVVTGLVLVLFLSALMLVEADGLRSGLISFVRPERRDRARAVARSALAKLGIYVRAQLLVMTVVGVATTVGLIVLGVPFALPLGFLAFLGEAIPIVGVYVSSIPIVILAFLQGPLTGVLTLAFIIALQQFEAYVLTPFVQKRAIKLSPVVTLLAILIAAQIAGVLGALVAVPLVAVVQVTVQQVILPWRMEGTARASGGYSEGESAEG